MVGIPNDIKTIFTGEDIYGNEATSVDKGIAVLDMVTLGLSSKLMNVPVSIAKRSDIANKGTTIYSVFVTTYNGIKEKRNE